VIILAMALGIGLVPELALTVARAEAPEVKLDCTVYETRETNLGIAFKVAQFIFKVGPELSFSHRAGVAWDKVVHGTIARYVELCNRYNAGLVGKAEYETRLKEIDGLYKETQEMEAKLYEATRQRAMASSDELDEMLGRKRPAGSSNVQLETSVERLAERVEHMEPISKPLKPAPPCRPPDMLGAPGAQDDPGRSC
jgi:hypothetical protein